MQNTRNKELVSSYLKMHTTLSNAFKETEAVNGMYVKKMDEVTFKEYFESHLKKLATCEDYDVCLTDGSKFNYGTYNEGCPTGTCMELTIDTNGNRMPNKSGKDIFTMLVTDRGIKALGESNMCETGLDCGAYILANHKLYDGTVNEVTPPTNQPTAEQIAAYEQCKASGATVCTTPTGEEAQKVGNEYLTKAQRKANIENNLSEIVGTLASKTFDQSYLLSFSDGASATELTDFWNAYGPSSVNVVGSVAIGAGTDAIYLSDGSALFFQGLSGFTYVPHATNVDELVAKMTSGQYFDIKYTNGSAGSGPFVISVSEASKEECASNISSCAGYLQANGWVIPDDYPYGY